MQSKSGIAIVTGAARGIGRAMAAALGGRGYALWLVDIREAALARAADARGAFNAACYNPAKVRVPRCK